MIVLEKDRVSDWLRSRIVKPKIEAWMGYWAAMGYEVNQELIGAVVWDSFTPVECAMHIAIERPIPRSVVKEVFKYPFHTVGLKRLSVSTAASNHKAQRIIERWGFTLEGIKRLGCGDEDQLMYGLLKEECKFHGW